MKNKKNIIVIGASAGGFELLQQLVKELPRDLPASIFIVWHTSPDVKSVLQDMLNRQNTMPVVEAKNLEKIEVNRVYLPVPDHHLILQNDQIRVSKGPKENRFRPAVDPLFRSAAISYGPRVIGVVLSGGLDDGTAGLWMIKKMGGISIVQDPSEAVVPSMPENALREVKIDYVLKAGEIAAMLTELVMQDADENFEPEIEPFERAKLEVEIALQDPKSATGPQFVGQLTGFSCPECQGVLSAIKEEQRIRYRCHTGHAFSSNSLLAGISEKVENSLWNTIRAVEESMILLNHMGDHFADISQTKIAAQYFRKAKDLESTLLAIKKSVAKKEHVAADFVENQR